MEEKNQILSDNKEEQISGKEIDSNSKNPQKRRSRIDSGVGLDINNSIDGCTGEKFRDIFRSKLNKARRMSLAAKSKQKSRSHPDLTEHVNNYKFYVEL